MMITRRAALVVVLLLTGAHRAHAQAPPDRAAESTASIHLVVGAFVTMAGADLAVSTYQIGRGAAREAAFGSAWQNSPLTFTVSKSAMTAVFAYALQKMHKSRPKTAIVLGIAATGVEAWLVARGAGMTPPAR